MTPPLVRSALLGSATGSRAFTGLAAVAVTAPHAKQGPDHVLSRSWVKGGAALLAVQEYVLDKLPQAPSRMEPPGLIMRGVAGAASGALISMRRHPAEPRLAETDEPERPRSEWVRTAGCAVLGAAAAVGAAWVGVRWRAWAGDALDNDLVPALAEDGVAIGLALLGARR